MAVTPTTNYTGSNDFSSGPYLSAVARFSATRASETTAAVTVSCTLTLGFGHTASSSAGSSQNKGYGYDIYIGGGGKESPWVVIDPTNVNWVCDTNSNSTLVSGYPYTGKTPTKTATASISLTSWTKDTKKFTVYVYETTGNAQTGAVSTHTYKGSFEVNLSCPSYYSTITISYDGNGATSGSMSNTTYTYASTGTTKLAVNNYQKNGYYFYGWHRTKNSATAGEREYTDGQNWNLNNAGPTYTLYAAWRPNTYTVTYNSNGGSGTMESSTATYNQNFITSQNTFTRIGYTFNGWNTAADGSGTENWGLNATGVYESGLGPWKWTYDSDRLLYAQWIVNSYTLTVNAGEGTLTATSGWEIIGNTATKTLDYGSTYGTLPTPTRTGYVFLGWYTSTSGGTQVTNNTTMSDSNAEVFAHWAVAEYTVVYNANTGSGTTPNSQTFGYSESINLASSSGLTLSNYTANGWNTASGTNQSSNTHFDNGAVFNSASTTFNNNHSVTLYVHWVGAQYTISYNANGGSGAPTSHTGNYGTSLTIKTTIPTRTNYYFKGWNTKQDGSGDTYQPGETYNKYLTVTLYAQWESNDFSINFDSNYLQDYNVTRNQVAFGIESKDNVFNSHSVLSQGLYTTGIYVKSAILDNYGTGVLSGQLMASNLDRALTKASYSSGIMGSINLTTAYTNSTPNIPIGWYNYIYVPHRNGGSNGAAQSDNCNYGSMLLFGMNNNNGIYRIKRDALSVEKFYTTSNKPTYSELGTVPIANGGTGATTAANARTNLGLGTAATYAITTLAEKGKIPIIGSGDRGFEIGPYLDFHYGDNSTDKDARISCTGTGALSVAASAGITLNGNLTTSKNILGYKVDADSVAAYVRVKQLDNTTDNTAQADVSLEAAASNNHGIYSYTQDKWLAAYLADGTPYFNGAALTDQIIEQGTKTTSGGVGASWVYRKWKSGRLEAWGWKSYSSLNYTTSAGVGYYTNIGTFYFPFTLQERPYCLASVDFGNVGSVSTSSLGPSSVYVSVWSTSNTARATAITVYIHGKY